MKAVEYVKKYEPVLYAEHNEEVKYSATLRLIMELTDEANEIVKIRHGELLNVSIGAFKEMDIKWRSICSKMEHIHGGVQVLKHSGFKDFWMEQVPSLKKYWTSNRSGRK